jgi:hypothetical protein
VSERPSVRELIVVPSIITLAVTLLRLAGELQNWSPALFSREAGGRLALVGIAWLVPIFGIYFALKLAGAGERPASAWGVAGYAVLAIVMLVAAGFVGGGLLRLPQIAMLILFGVLSWVAIIMVRRAWPALSSVLVQYGLAARIPVVIVMLIAMLANWGTHYDVPPPNAPEIAQWPVLLKWFVIGVIPQLTVWMAFTVVLGALFGAVAVALKGRPQTA